MSSLAATLTSLAHGGGRVLRIPTAILLVWACAVVVVLGWQIRALLLEVDGAGRVGVIVVAVLVVLLVVPVLVLAVRRRRWLARTEQATQAAKNPSVVEGTLASTGVTDLVTIDALGDRIESEMRGRDGEQDVRAVMDAFTEFGTPSTQRRGAGARLTSFFGVGRLAIIGRVFGRMERAQRALLTAAGGPVQAPYLVDDLRVTVAAFVGTLVTIGLGSVAIVVLGVVLTLT